MGTRNQVFRNRLAFASVAALVSPLAVATPAAAFSPDPVAHYAIVVLASGCPVVGGSGTLQVAQDTNGCRIRGYNGTWVNFGPDPGGRAMLADFVYNGPFPNDSYLAARLEWHPLDEIFKIRDMSNDDDTLYASLQEIDSLDIHGTYSAPGTSATVDTFTKDLNLDEDTAIWVNLFDLPNDDPIDDWYNHDPEGEAPIVIS
jgi:hypothetical protein